MAEEGADMVVNNDREWRWDQTKAKTFEGEDAAKAGRAFLMKAAGVDNIDDAVRVLRGRPRVEEPREETVRLQVVVPKSWQAELDRSAAAEHITRSAYLRKLIRPRKTPQPA